MNLCICRNEGFEYILLNAKTEFEALEILLHK